MLKFKQWWYHDFKADSQAIQYDSEFHICFVIWERYMEVEKEREWKKERKKGR